MGGINENLTRQAAMGSLSGAPALPPLIAEQVGSPAPVAMQMETFSDLIRRYEDAKAIKADLEEQAKRVGGEIEALEKEIVTAFNDLADAQGLDDASKFTVEVDGFKYGVSIKGYYDIPADQKAAAIEILRDLGHGDLIKEDIPKKALEELFAGLLEENDGTIPEEYQAMGARVFEKIKLTRNKVPAGKKKGVGI